VLFIQPKHSFETRPGHWLGQVIRSRVRWVDPGKPKKTYKKKHITIIVSPWHCTTCSINNQWSWHIDSSLPAWIEVPYYQLQLSCWFLEIFLKFYFRIFHCFRFLSSIPFFTFLNKRSVPPTSISKKTNLNPR
jgi:hypothetical protein